jgi:putative peptide zinc metalloprotease protein
MVLCAAVSLVFNANPLMKYDGYYLFCEVLEIADLQLAARTAWIEFWQRMLGVNLAKRPRSQYRWNRSLQWLLRLYYPIAAGYRWSISFALLIGILLTFHAWELTELGWMLSSMMVILGLGITIDRRIIKLHAQESISRKDARDRKALAGPRLLRWVVWCIALLGFFASALVPLPERVYAAGKITSANRVALYSTAPSTTLLGIDRSLNTAIYLDRTHADQELLRLRQSIEELDARQELIQKAAFFDASLLTQLPQLETVRHIREQRLDRLEEQFNAYTIQIPSTDRFVAVPLASLEDLPVGFKAGLPVKDNLRKFPTVMSNLQQGILIQQGTLLGYRCPRDREIYIEVTLPQESRSDVYVGQTANVRVTQLPFNYRRRQSVRSRN